MNLFGWKKRCRQLEAENRRLQERNAWLEKRLLEVDEKNTQLAQSLVAAKKNSTNSSKPPSSDIVKPPPKGRIGAQKGHPKHERTPFTPDQIDRQIPHRLQRCPVNPSHHIVAADDRKRTLQQVELVKDPFKVIEHVAYGIWCEDCQRYHDAPFPPEVVAAGLCGPRLTSLVCCLSKTSPTSMKPDTRRTLSATGLGASGRPSLWCSTSPLHVGRRF